MTNKNAFGMTNKRLGIADRDFWKHRQKACGTTNEKLSESQTKELADRRQKNCNGG
jgi:hypothetical protein